MLSHGPQALKAWSGHTAWEKENSTPKLALNQQHTIGLTSGHTLEPENGCLVLRVLSPPWGDQGSVTRLLNPSVSPPNCHHSARPPTVLSHPTLLARAHLTLPSPPPALPLLRKSSPDYVAVLLCSFSHSHYTSHSAQDMTRFQEEQR